MTVTKEQALKALDRMQSLYPHAKPDATLRQFIEQSQDSGHAPAPTDELREALADLIDLIEVGMVKLNGAKLYPAGKNRVEAARALLSAPASAPQQPTDMQAKQAEFAGMHDFLNWNRAQPEPLVKIACEYGVFSKAVALYRAALAGAAPAPQTELLREVHAQIRHLIDDLTDAVDDGGLVRYVPRQNLTFSNCIAALIPLADRLLGAAPTQAPQQPTLSERLQQKCSDWGTYWRAPDAHGVVLSQDQALELLRDALGVEVEFAGGISFVEAWCVLTDTDWTTVAHTEANERRCRDRVEGMIEAHHRARGVKACQTCGGSGEVRGLETIAGKPRRVVNNCPDCNAGVPPSDGGQQG